MLSIIKKHAKEFRNAIAQGGYALTSNGVLFPKQQVLASGRYFHTVNGTDLRIDDNLLPDQGLIHMLDVTLKGGTAASGWYLALFAGAVNPAASWTAANFASVASEITSSSEGYSNATRPQWTPSAASSNAINNLSSKAQFDIAATSSIEINGAALISDNAKGGTSGKLISAARFDQTRTQFDGDTFEVGYEVSLTG